MRIAAVQFHVDHDNKQSNWDHVEYFLAEAQKQKVDLIVFPEFFMGGPGRRSTIVNGKERFGELARRYNLDIVPGTLVEQDQTDKKYYNVEYYIDKSGEALLAYRKVHLWAPERRYLTEGRDGFPVAKNRFGITVGLCACWDIVFNEVFREMVMDHKAQLVICPAYWTLDDISDIAKAYDPECETKLIDGVCTSRAFENQCCVVFSNIATYGEKELRQPFGISAGRSQIVVPFKGPIAHCNHNREAMIIADVDVAKITEDAETVYQLRSDWDQGRAHIGLKSKI